MSPRRDRNAPARCAVTQGGRQCPHPRKRFRPVCAVHGVLRDERAAGIERDALARDVLLDLKGAAVVLATARLLRGDRGPLADVLARLPVRQRLVVIGRQGGAPMSHLARVLKVTRQTVYQDLRAARRVFAVVGTTIP